VTVQPIDRLRLVVFTAGPLTPVNRVFFERLASDPLFDLAAIVVDEYQRPRKPLLTRIARSIRAEGIGWLGFKLGEKLRSASRSAMHRMADSIHGRTANDDSYETLAARIATPIYRVTDIHDAGSIALIRSLSPQLGVIAGGRILRDAVTTLPAHGTLNIHKRRVPEYRGGGPVGYWEVLAGEREIGVTIHYASCNVDAGPVLAETTIPIEECDTLESLALKADIRGAQLYHETLRRFAQGHRIAVPQDCSRGTTYRAPSDYKVWRLQRELARRATRTMDAMHSRPSRFAAMRVFVEYLAVLPGLIGLRKRFVRERRAPVSILFYHLVSNRPLNHMCLPLQDFVEQVEFLRRHYPILSLDEAVQRLRSGENDRIAAAITFDDGYRDNKWAIEYLRYFQIPATFFVSIGHVRDGSGFEHDRKRQFHDAHPMSEAEVRALAEDGFIVGSHGVHHEDFGTLAPIVAEYVLRESKQLIGDTCGREPVHFAFPKGQRGINITEPTFKLALAHYRYVFGAYGGYSFPQSGRRHFARMGNPLDVRELGMRMTGYTGFRECLSGNAWGIKTDKLDPCSSSNNAIALAPV
jgi:folate-dependent phosphoribosylglycinamide formyltransferase PurN/peptidoglycan/xylan/chitin deacetylase (PgdA/CDA1 family)